MHFILNHRLSSQIDASYLLSHFNLATSIRFLGVYINSTFITWKTYIDMLPSNLSNAIIRTAKSFGCNWLLYFAICICITTWFLDISTNFFADFQSQLLFFRGNSSGAIEMFQMQQKVVRLTTNHSSMTKVDSASGDFKLLFFRPCTFLDIFSVSIQTSDKLFGKHYAHISLKTQMMFSDDVFQHPRHRTAKCNKVSGLVRCTVSTW